MAWPPQLSELKDDLGITDTRDDDRLTRQLDAAIAYVAGPKGRAGSFNFAGDPVSEMPAPGEDIALGTLRLAGRWNTRRRSPDGLVNAGELGNSTVPSLDADIERLLGIGRYREPMLG